MFRNRWNVSLIVLLVLIVASLACNAAGTGATLDVGTIEATSTPQPQGGATGADEPTDVGVQPESDEEPVGQQPVDSGSEETGSDTDICPTPTDGTLMYRSDEFGYCFLYPADYTFNPNWNIYEYGLTAFRGEPLDPNSMEPVVVGFQVTYNGPAVEVTTANEYASKWVAVNNIPPDVAALTPGNLGGHEAAIIEQQPGMLPQQVAYTVVDGRKYSVAMQPTIGAFPDLVEEGQATWDLVTGSIVFFPPTGTHSWVLASDVCPIAVDGTTLHLNEHDGMCFLVPDGWTREEGFGGSTFTTGEVLGQMDGFGDIVPRFALAFHGTQGNSVEEVLQPFVDAGVDPATFQNFTAGGYPGIEYDEPRGPFHQRGAMILTDRGSYSIVANPYDPNIFPESIPQIDVMWDTAVNSVQFFTPWR